MDDVVVFPTVVGLGLGFGDEGNGVLDYGGVVDGKVEILGSKCVDYGVDLYDGGRDAVGDER